MSITVIIAAHNAAATIARAVKSALAEPEVTEVIVVDDASIDATPHVAAEADDGSNRLKILTQKPNAGPSAARNRAIKESTAPWIAVLDADDFFLPGRMKALLSYVDQADFIADDLWQAPENNIDERTKTLLELKITAPRTVKFTEFVLSNVTDSKRTRGELGFIKPLMRREFLVKHSIAYKETMRLGEDYELYTRSLAVGGRLLLVPTTGYVAVVRAESLSGNHSLLDLWQLRECDRDLSRINGLTNTETSALNKHYLSIDCRLQWRLLIEAVKARRLFAAMACFVRPWPVPMYLVQQLAQQCILRTGKLLRGENK